MSKLTIKQSRLDLLIEDFKVALANIEEQDRLLEIMKAEKTIAEANGKDFGKRYDVFTMDVWYPAHKAAKEALRRIIDHLGIDPIDFKRFL